MSPDIPLTHSKREDGAVLESREPLSGEPAGRSHRDGLSAAPSPVARCHGCAENKRDSIHAYDTLEHGAAPAYVPSMYFIRAKSSRWTISVEDAGKLFIVLVLGILFSMGLFLVWAVISHGR